MARIKRNCLLATLVVLPFLAAYSQGKLYVSMSDLSPEVENKLSRVALGYPILVTQGFIDPHNDLKVNEDRLRLGISRLFPDDQMEGIGILDWEGEAFRILRAGKSHEKFQSVLSEFLKALRIAKSMRPNIQWGFYEVPIITAPGRKTEEDIKELLKECDVLLASIYQYYPYALSERNEGVVTDDVRYSISLGLKYNKPVMAMVWHRWIVPNISKTEYQLISVDQFKKHVQQVSLGRYKEKALDGIIWWGADKYFQQNKMLNVTEYQRYRDFNEYHSKMILNYFDAIKPYFSK